MSEVDAIFDGPAARLERRFAHIAATAMAGMPLCNGALGVRCSAMTPIGEEWLGVLITPWFMNLVLMPDASAPQSTAQTGVKSRVALPSGMIEFIQSQDEELGAYRMCSLFSPVFEFTAIADAAATADAVLEELMKPAGDAPEDPGMLAVWEGRIGDAEAERRRLEARHDAEAQAGPPELSRRALFGLPAQHVADGAER